MLWCFAGITQPCIATVPPQVEYKANTSAYTSSIKECGKADGITASGTQATEGRTVACDDLPLGTTIYLNKKPYIVEDRFGGGYKHRIDIYMKDVNKAIQFGRKNLIFHLDMYLLKENICIG